ncbi:MAG: preprotein translocase subunit SecG [Planctomycetota bacterium]
MTLPVPIGDMLPLASIMSSALGFLMFGLSIFLILLVLVQRGKGGGLTGALGGPGGQSAFGSKAGDTFTVITAVSAIVWGIVCAIAMYTLGVPPATADDEFSESGGSSISSTDEESTGMGSLDDLGDIDDLLSGGLGEPADDESSTAGDDSESADGPADGSSEPDSDAGSDDNNASGSDSSSESSTEDQ